MRKIALEEHFATAELEKRGLVARPTRSETLFADIERRLADFDELRLAAMDSAGIDLSVLSATTPGVQGEKDTATAIRLAQQANDLLAQQVHKRPGRYAGFAAVPLQDPAAAIKELQRAIKDLGFKGTLINGQTNGHYLDDERFLPFWEAVQDLDVPVYLHPGDLPDKPAMFAGRPELNGPVWAWTADTGAHALRLIFSGLFTRLPRLKVILGHMGETLPFLLWRIDNRYELEVGKSLAPDARPSFFFRRNFVITTSGVCDNAPLIDALSALGEDNILFSVDYPYQDSKQAGDFIDNAPVSDAVRAKICNGNAKRVLHL
ncbi:MAG: amidohydrolase [Proteobacteria bacterium]|nr:amidohydrolase [Pseudomonadota bacterium]